ncbi:protein borderless-like [Glossina fuscipes fuscipes]
MRILQKNVMEATIQRLLPGRKYEFMFLSQDKHGDGLFRKQIRFSTQSSKVIAEDESAVAGERENHNHPQQPQEQHQQ